MYVLRTIEGRRFLARSMCKHDARLELLRPGLRREPSPKYIHISYAVRSNDK